MKKVSVIIPSYGSNTNPCRAIDSVLNQDYKNVEVILVDDNGKGSNQQLFNESLFEKYRYASNFKYLVHECNMGGSVARNTGAHASTGDYICFLDDDDEFAEKNKISLQMQEAIGLDDTWAGTYSSLRIFQGNRETVIKAKNSGFLLEEFILGDMSIGTAAPIITRESFDAINGFDGSFERHQDWEFYARLMDKYKLKAVPSACYNRYYKMDVPKKPIDTRIKYMNKYVQKMKSSLTSLPKRKLDELMRRKYIPIVFGLLKEKRICDAASICRENDFCFSDYVEALREMIAYIIEKHIRGNIAK